MPYPVEYQVVYAFDQIREEYTVRGIFTKKEDADAFWESIKDKVDCESGAVVTRTHDQLVDSLIQERLGILARPLQGLLELTVILRPVLRNADGMPAAVVSLGDEA
jgi:hypothetical protein